MFGSNNLKILENTLSIFESGGYTKNGKTVATKLDGNKIKECIVFLPDEVHDIAQRVDLDHLPVLGRMGVSCENIDTFAMAHKQYMYYKRLSSEISGKILVLNFANPVNPGGGVRRGARAQEEELCRRSSLLFSLENENAARYYKYNRSLNTYLGSDAVILTPNVEIIKDVDGTLLDESFVVSVITCAAPMLVPGREGLSHEEYTKMFYNRICGILKCAAYWGYKSLVLGAFGCGAFGNDGAIVSDLFYKALKELDFDGMSAKDFFERVDFAVLDRSIDKYNFKEFNRNFQNFYREEDNDSE